jgi:LysR family hydrogen peroxide-inducible transcriptional activator
MPRGHALAQEVLIDTHQVAAESVLLLGNGNCFRDQVVQACPQLSAPGGTEGALEGSSLETVRYMVASGAGISVVPVSAAASWPREDALLVSRPFRDPVPLRRVIVAWRATFPRPQAIDVLRAAILDAPPPGVVAA